MKIRCPPIIPIVHGVYTVVYMQSDDVHVQ